ncbi:MAG: tol-pal system protein YbgF [Legionellales bacterium]|nr:tol-pal system protein YbgF [Legionellales bacterium]
MKSNKKLNRFEYILATGIAVLTMPVGVSLANAPIIQGHSTTMNVTKTASSSVPAPAPLNASATTQTPEQALVTGEDLNASAPANPLDTGNRIAMLQQQVQDLRGQLEVQAHTIAQLQSEVSQLSGGKFPATVSTTSSSISQTTADASDPATPQTPAIPQTGDSAAPATGLTQSLVTATAAPSETASSGATVTAATPAQPTTNAVAAPIPAPTETELYQKAYDLMVAKQYTQASVQLQTYLQAYPKGQYAADSHYSLGEMALISGNLTQAQAQFNVVINQFPQSAKVSDAMLKDGMIESSQSKWKQAKTQFNAVIRAYPGTPSAQMAQQQLEEIQRSGN